MIKRYSCEICFGKGIVTDEYPNKEMDDMVQRESKCECEVEGTDAFDKRENFELHQRAGLVCVGKNLDGELEWVGTDEQWSEYSDN